MLLESVTATAKRAEELLNIMNKNSINSESTICVEDHFTGLILLLLLHSPLKLLLNANVVAFPFFSP